jgi:hypothetical protein
MGKNNGKAEKIGPTYAAAAAKLHCDPKDLKNYLDTGKGLNPASIRNIKKEFGGEHILRASLGFG